MAEESRPPQEGVRRPRRLLLCAPVALAAALLISACGARTTGVSDVTASSVVLHAKARCDQGESCKWYWEYWRATQPRSSSSKTQAFGPVGPTSGNVALTEPLTTLSPHTRYRWVFCGSPNSGGFYECVGPHGNFDTTTADPPKDFATFTTLPGWVIQPTPFPGGIPLLQGVSCTSQTACTAVGLSFSGTLQLPVVERWDGTAWTLESNSNPRGPSPLPPGPLSGISCISDTSCIGVGAQFTGNNTAVTLAATSDGSSWTVQPTPNPTGASTSVLFDVSCTSTTSCTAVGIWDNGSGTREPLAEHWDGTSWAIQNTPSPPGANLTPTKSGVSCTSTNACTAVWSYTDSTGTGMTLVERWDGTSWTIQTTPGFPAGRSSSLLSVSCATAKQCIAVGSTYIIGAGPGAPLIERWDGTSWTIQSTPSVAGGGGLFGVSCGSATKCTAVGASTDSAGVGVTLAERWDGTSWTIQSTPNPAAATLFSNLLGVSCFSGAACTAVGDYGNGNSANPEFTLAEGYAG